MRLGILGSGDVAKTLGEGYLRKGYEVKLGSRDPAKLAEWARSAGDRASAGDLTATAAFGDVVFICVHGQAAVEAVKLAGRENFDRKLVIDVTNPLDFSRGVPPRFTATLGNSLAERIQSEIPDADVVKAFNTVNRTTMVDPTFSGETATLFIAGDSDEAKSKARELIGEFGWEIEDQGGLEQAFFLEAFASMWVNYAFRHNSWEHAFKLLRK